MLAFLIYAGLARLVGPESFGVVALGLVYISFTEILIVLGFNTSLVQRRDVEHGHFNSAFWVSLGMAIGLTAATIAAAPWLSSLFGEPRLGAVLVWLSLALVFIGLTAVPQAVLTREMAFRTLAIRSSLATAMGGIVGLAMAWLGYGIWSLVAQQLVNAGVGAAVLWWATTWRPTFPPSLHHLRDLKRFALSTAGNNALWFGTQRADQSLIGYAFGAAALGPYALASRCIQLALDSVVAPAQVVALPAFSQLQDERQRLLNAFYRMTEAIAVVAFPAFCGIALLAPALVPLAFGAAWVPAVPLLQMLAVYALFRIPMLFGHPLMMAIGRPGIYLVLVISQTALTVTLCLLGLRWGVLGVAGAVVLSMALQLVIQLAVWRRLAGLSVKSLGSRLWVPVFGSTIMTVVLAIFMSWTGDTTRGLPVVAGGVALGAGIYAIVTGMLRPALVRELSRGLATRVRLVWRASL